MLSKSAQYLIRCDDLCPTMQPERWQMLQSVLEEFSIAPLLAVVPDNQDPQLDMAPADPNFWARMRQLEQDGATIAMHGYQHRCLSYGRPMMRVHRHSEFAGVDAETQRHWMRAGLTILRGHGLNPKVFIAPRHGFDHNTLAAMRAEGLGILSDGDGRVVHRKHGLIWIPQQLWAPQEHSRGLWTICLHSNFLSKRNLQSLREFIRVHQSQFTSVDRIVREHPSDSRSIVEGLYAQTHIHRRSLKRLRKWMDQRFKKKATL